MHASRWAGAAGGSRSCGGGGTAVGMSTCLERCATTARMLGRATEMGRCTLFLTRACPSVWRSHTMARAP